MDKWLRYAGIFGIISIIFVIPLSIISIITLQKSSIIGSRFFMIYILSYVVSILFYTLFISGFISIGKKLHNAHLVHTTYYLIAGSIVLSAVQMIAPFLNKFHGFALQAIILVILGIISIVFGRTLTKLELELGTIGKKAGQLNIIVGVSLVTVILSFIAVLFLIPLYVVEIIILFKASKKF